MTSSGKSKKPNLKSQTPIFTLVIERPFLLSHDAMLKCEKEEGVMIRYTVDSLYLEHPLLRTSLYLELKGLGPFVYAATYFSLPISKSLYLEQIFLSLASSR